MNFLPLSTDQANYHGRFTYGNGKESEFRNTTIPVCSFKPNAFGLHDMHGNIWEWCSDWYDSKYYANADTRDPAGPNSGTAHVSRGGAWLHSPRGCRSATRSWLIPIP